MENSLSTTSLLPCDIVFEILTWVPLQSLSKCISVSEEWKKMTYQKYFIDLHCQRTETLKGYFIQSLKKNKYHSQFVSMNQNSRIPPPSLDFLPEDVKIEASSTTNGLLCCTSRGKFTKYYICKPATKEWRKIPNPKTRYFTERIALVVQSSTPLQYKIIRFSWPKKQYDHLICEIFDSQSWRWRRSVNVKMGYQELLSLRPGALMNGSLYWLTTYHRIFGFNVENEKCRMISLPQEQCRIDDVRKYLVEYEGQLSICYSKDTWIDIWAMKDIDTKTELWERKKTLIKTKGEGSTRSLFKDFYTSEVALMFDYFAVNWYNFETRNSMETKIGNQPNEAYSFQSDSTPLLMDAR